MERDSLSPEQLKDQLLETIDGLVDEPSEIRILELLENIRSLIAAGCDVNDEEPIFPAIRLAKNLELVKILVEAGAEVNVMHPDDFNTPLFAAKYAGLTEIAEYLEPLTDDELRRHTEEMLQSYFRR
jgi:Ankyrin repeats (many copies)